MIAPIESSAIGGGRGSSFQLKVVLDESRPQVWRRLVVPGDGNLGWLHAVLQVAMGWTNSHLHHFLIGDAIYSDPRSWGDMDIGEESERDEGKTTLARATPWPKARFTYEYDFGDSWEHLITVEKILPADSASVTVAQCLDGARACPPEDCGGVWGYANLLKIIKNPKHKEYDSTMEWLGGKSDPAAFDLEDTNAWLRQLKWPRTTENQLAKVLMARDAA